MMAHLETWERSDSTRLRTGCFYFGALEGGLSRFWSRSVAVETFGSSRL